jgi:hypothetical protein
MRQLQFSVPDVKQEVAETSLDSSITFKSVGADGVALARPTISFSYGGPKYVPASAYKENQYQISVYGKRAETSPSRPTALLKLDGFLTQRVLYYKKTWIGRADVVKYIANVAGGVHSGALKEIVHTLLHEIRQLASMKRGDDGKPAIRIHPHTIFTGTKPIDVDKDGLDFVLLQLLAAAHHLVTSPDIVELESLIKSEKV